MWRDCFQLEAYDPDIPDRSEPQHIQYFVVKQELQKFLRIDKKGCLSLSRVSLDFTANN